jgi:hypothetical protein
MAIAGALGLAVQLLPDPDARVQPRWERHSESYVERDRRLSKAAIKKATPIVVAELASKGGRSRWANSTPEQRLEVGKFLGRATSQEACASSCRIVICGHK